MDNKTNPSDTQWQNKLWHLRFAAYGGSIAFYTISSNTDGNTNVDQNEAAIDPANGKRMYHLAGDSTLDEADESPSIFIKERYGINAVNLTGGCSGGQLIAFDHLGRPHVGIYGATNDYGSYMSSDCTMTFGFSDASINSFQIIIEQETGHAYIVGQPNS